ncbi:STAS-like domain-containing protein [Methylotenera sp. L2L1]|uniref:STAS-like domain-containing protein n=1 Tax=Methylotenera sp. L2L1 TaxID=1502770 RepID=UPI0005659602|nr:STAS-like domain-containing protein [Methylotenera sp. L2L1]
MKILNIGKDFSSDPIGRFRSDGNRSGETFREDFLKPALDSLEPNEKLEIIIDDEVESYGSSFLSEGFAGLVKYGFITAEEFHRKIEIKYTNEDFEFFKSKIIEYVNTAKYNSKTYVPTKS